MVSLIVAFQVSLYYACDHRAGGSGIPHGLARSEPKRGGKKTVDAPEQSISQPPDEIVEPVQARARPALLPVGQLLAVDELAVLAFVEQSPTLPESACQ
jgi:hypothetical protein